MRISMKKGLLIGASLLLLLSGCSKKPERLDSLIADTIQVKNENLSLRLADWYSSEEEVTRALDSEEITIDEDTESATRRLSVDWQLEDMADTGLSLTQVCTIMADQLYRMEYYITTNSEAEYQNTCASLAGQCREVFASSGQLEESDYAALESGSEGLVWIGEDEASISIQLFDTAGEPRYYIIITLEPPVIVEEIELN